MLHPSFAGLDWVATAILLLDQELRVLYANPAAENLFELSNKFMPNGPLEKKFSGAGRLVATAKLALSNNQTYVEHELTLEYLGGRQQLLLDCTMTPLQTKEAALLLEFRQLNQQIKIAREERIRQEQQLNRELIRNLAHEIKNPLGGIRGAAQLLENELGPRELKEYTRVIVAEADRLQSLLDRLLTPQRLPHLTRVNLHELLERVRSLIMAEFTHAIKLVRDYDISLPEIESDAEQLLQAFLNIARNAAQALRGHGTITLRTRVAHRVTVAKKRYRMVLMAQIIDDGPGVKRELRDKIFFPLVTGREDGTGLGLTIAQNYILQQQGMIEFESEPGRTCFTVTLPVVSTEF